MSVGEGSVCNGGIVWPLRVGLGLGLSITSSAESVAPIVGSFSLWMISRYASWGTRGGLRQAASVLLATGSSMSVRWIPSLVGIADDSSLLQPCGGGRWTRRPLCAWWRGVPAGGAGCLCAHRCRRLSGCARPRAAAGAGPPAAPPGPGMSPGLWKGASWLPGRGDATRPCTMCTRLRGRCRREPTSGGRSLGAGRRGSQRPRRC